MTLAADHGNWLTGLDWPGIFCPETVGEDLLGKDKLGTKRGCQACGAPFYDLNKVPPLCPKCGAEFKFKAVKPKKPKPVEKAEPKKARPEADSDDSDDGIDIDLEEADIDDQDDDEEESVMEDTSDFGEDDDVGVGVKPSVHDHEK
ncbi:MAG: FYDLN acid domain-containing protein [Alphaproteobacteria bacterium]